MAKKKDSVVERIRRFNAGRDPERLALKYAAMRKSAFAFLRGTCHLFYEDLPKAPLLNNAPAVWACGDLHLENFGSYKGDNRLVYFDLNDFDEALLAPCTWDLLRLLTSILVAGKTLRITPPQALTLCRHFLDAYVGAIQNGKARWIERETAEGLIKELLANLQQRKRKPFLDSRTVKKGGRRKIRIDGKHALAATAAQKRRVRAFMVHFSRTQPNSKFFRVLDVARRIAGTGSLGVGRYVMLVEGKGSPDQNYLLDLKQALPSALSSRVKVRQSRWENEAQRIVTIQRRVQAISMAFLHPVIFKGTPYVLRYMQPSEDRITLDGRNRRFAGLDQLMNALGNLIAWGELRSSARQGSATADELDSFWEKQDRRKKLVNLAQGCASWTYAQWEEYCRAFDKGIFS
jgi:uncharacterized protein (DUF2252 family)